MLGEQLRQYIKDSPFSMADVARSMSISPQALNSRLNASDVGISTLIGVAKAINKNLYELLDNVAEHAALPERVLASQAGIVMVDTTENSVVPLIDIKVAAGSPTLLDEPDYYRSLPAFTFPNFVFKGTLVGMQVRGESMTPTIKQGDYVVGSYLEDVTQLRDGEVYIIIYQEDQLVRFTVKRCYYFQGDTALTLQSDNSDYPSDMVPLPALLKVYHVLGCMTTQLHRSEPPVRRMLERIERRIDRLEKHPVN